MTTNLRRNLALVAGLVAVAAPVLSGCGTQATDRFNVLANAGYSLSNGIHVDGTRIVASADGQGYFVATLGLDPTEDAATTPKKFDQSHALVGISVAPGNPDTVQPQGSVHKVIGPLGIANLNTTDKSVGGVGGIPVTGNFKAGDIIPLVLTFDNGSGGTVKATVRTPVVTDCFEYSGAGTSSYQQPSAIPSPSQAASPGVYDCAYPSFKPIG